MGLKPKLNEPLESDAVLPLPKRRWEFAKDEGSFFSSGLEPKRFDEGFSSEGLVPKGFEKEEDPVSVFLK